MLLIDVLLPEYDRETGLTRYLLERIPDSQLDWQPHETSMPLGRLASHLADLPRWIDIVMTCDDYDLEAHPDDPPEVTSSSGLLTRFDGNVSSARLTLTDSVDGSFSVPWTLRRGKVALFRLPRVGALRYFVLNHLVHHRGQLTVYLRMLGVPIPPIYGPSADAGSA